MERTSRNVKEESEEMSSSSNDRQLDTEDYSRQHSCLEQSEEDGNRNESVKEEPSARRKRDEFASTDNDCNMNDEKEDRECSICGNSIPVMNFDIHFSNCARSTRRTNRNVGTTNRHAAARTTLSISSNLYNDTSQQPKEEDENNDDDERKPAARQDMQEGEERNEQVINIDDSMEVDETSDSPPRQRPRYANNGMNTRSRTHTTSRSSQGGSGMNTLPNRWLESAIEEVVGLPVPLTSTARTRNSTRSSQGGRNSNDHGLETSIEEVIGLTTPLTSTARTRSFTSRTRAPEVVDLTDSPEKPSPDNQHQQEQNTEWACPRCTLLNSQSDRRCDACNLPRPDANDDDSPDGNLRPPDSSFRDRLIDPTSSSSSSINLSTRDRARTQFLMDEIFNHLSPQPRRPPRRSFMDSVGQHAILGSAVGAVSAISGMGGGRGSNVLGSTLQGAVAGAVGGAISHGIASISGNNNSSSSSRRNSGTRRTTRSATRNRNDTDIDHNPPPEPNRPEIPESLRRLGRSYRTFNGPGFRVVMMNGSLPPEQVQQLQAQGMGVHLVRMQQGPHPVDGMSYERLLEIFGDGSENRSTDPEVIRSLPSSTIVDVEKEVPKDRRQCCICLDEFENGQKRKTLQCLHGFHEECIDKWLKGSRNCPICKFDVQGSA
ncbi:E3 ubiquitin-protein ligase Arkadia [Chaetoceros tenuissimus]|uniref:RING-type E3 ubiquitin transferase n=1 Tax=Chaetoceros tenuissimus TaxID=426638 RepID=A0AAD3D2N4_9STRA|nr:E3 ubiquitin-protein ligase Arkadia [Chaetoceros tenuissimus]